jgi:hypothetical protein
LSFISDGVFAATASWLVSMMPQPQQQLAAPSCSSQDFRDFQNAVERSEVMPLEVADGASPGGLGRGIVA